MLCGWYNSPRRFKKVAYISRPRSVGCKGLSVQIDNSEWFRGTGHRSVEIRPSARSFGQQRELRHTEDCSLDVLNSFLPLCAGAGVGERAQCEAEKY